MDHASHLKTSEKSRSRRLWRVFHRLFELAKGLRGCVADLQLRIPTGFSQQWQDQFFLGGAQRTEFFADGDTDFKGRVGTGACQSISEESNQFPGCSAERLAERLNRVHSY